jgi:hypothetical protein
MGRRIVALLGTCAAMSALAIPAAQAAGTTTTFTLTGGNLSITAPASVNLGSGTTGDSGFTGQMGTVSVSDLRGGLLSAWTATAAASDFTTGAGTANETITKSKISYWSGAATASSGVGTFLGGQLTALLKVALGATQTVFSAVSTVGNNSVSWNPTIIVDAGGAVAGTYTGTITHSVA